MKKILISICLLIFTTTLFAQVSDWPRIRRKQNFLDSVFFAKLPLLGGDTLATNAYARAHGGGITAGQAATQIGDSIAARMAGAETGIAAADSGKSSQYNYVTYKQLHEYASTYDTTYLYSVIDSLKDRITIVEGQLSAILDVLSGFDLDPTAFLSAEIGTFADDTIRVTMDTTDLRLDSIPSIKAFNITADGSPVALDTIALASGIVYIKLSAPAEYGKVYLANYNAANAHLYSHKKLQDSTGNKVVNWINKTVTNNIAQGAAPPLFLTSDGHTKGWYLFDEPTTITKDGADSVSVWADFLDSGNDLLAADNTKAQPIWSGSTGITFNGTNNFMATATFTLAQPTMIYAVMEVLSESPSAIYFDGYVAFSGAFMKHLEDVGVDKLHGGTPLQIDDGINTGAFHIVRVLFYSPSSKFILDSGSPVTGDTGSGNMSGFTIGAIPGGSMLWSHVRYKEIIVRDTVEASQDETDILNYLKTKYSL